MTKSFEVILSVIEKTWMGLLLSQKQFDVLASRQALPCLVLRRQLVSLCVSAAGCMEPPQSRTLLSSQRNGSLFSSAAVRVIFFFLSSVPGFVTVR